MLMRKANALLSGGQAGDIVNASCLQRTQRQYGSYQMTEEHEIGTEIEEFTKLSSVFEHTLLFVAVQCVAVRRGTNAADQ